MPRASSSAKRGRGTVRSTVEGAAAAQTIGMSSACKATGSEAWQPPPPPSVVPLPRFTGEDVRHAQAAFSAFGM